jgi:hypothetical protein
MRRTPTEDIVAAYLRTGSVWKAGRDLGLAGQTVHERLRAIGHQMNNQAWTDEECAYLTEMISNGVTAGEAGARLGRSFAAVTCKLNEIGVSRYGKPREVKVPRGAGYDKTSMGRHIKAITTSDALPTRYCRAHGLNINVFVTAAQKHFPDEWQAIAARSGIPQRECPYCKAEFYPANGKQQWCSRKCGADSARDASYFGGKRNQAIGMAEGVCQLCGREGHHRLSAHHVFGKENDPDNDVMVALCGGCHQIVTLLGGRAFIDDQTSWETLISLAWLRRHGADDHDGKALYVCVEIEHQDDDEEYEEVA